MLKKRWIVTLVALLVLAAGWFAGTQIAIAQSRDALAEKYTPLAGRNFAESVKAASLMGFFVFIAPAKWTIPSMFFTAGAAVLG